MKRVVKRLVNFFLQGLFYTVPITATIFVIYYLFNSLNQLIPAKVPGFGVFIVIALITFLGFIGSSFFVRPLFNFVNGLFEDMPLIKVLYTSIKDLMSAFVGKKKKFTEPVLVKMTKDSDLEKIGFVTKADLTDIGLSQDKVAVYFPLSFTFSGNIFIVPKENITPINVSSTEMMKFIISGGVTDFKTKEL